MKAHVEYRVSYGSIGTRTGTVRVTAPSRKQVLSVARRRIAKRFPSATAREVTIVGTDEAPVTISREDAEAILALLNGTHEDRDGCVRCDTCNAHSEGCDQCEACDEIDRDGNRVDGCPEHSGCGDDCEASRLFALLTAKLK